MRISNRMVGLHKELYGKGPTRARTLYDGDVLAVVLRGGFTAMEDTLHRAGRSASVVRQRSEVQEIGKSRFTDAIQELTGRKVVGFMSASQQDPDMSAEIFVLESREFGEPAE